MRDPSSRRLSPEDHVFLLETDRNTWIALSGTDEEGRQTSFRLAFTSLEKAIAFADAHQGLDAKRIREIRLGDVMEAGDPPLALDVDPISAETREQSAPSRRSK